MRRFAGPALILLAAFIAIVPQLIRGNSCGHDFNVHLVSWFDCLNAWRHGIPYPHWTPSANYGAGEPRFVYYPPLTWMLGAALGAILPWNLAPIALTFIILAATGLATRALALESLDDTPATLAGCVSIFSGFTLFTAYERCAFPEFAGGFWLPLIILFVLRDRPTSDRGVAPCPSHLGTWERSRINLRPFRIASPPRLLRLNRPARHRPRRRMALESSSRSHRRLSPRRHRAPLGHRQQILGSATSRRSRHRARPWSRRHLLGSRNPPAPLGRHQSGHAKIPATTLKTTGSSRATPIRSSPCTT